MQSSTNNDKKKKKKQNNVFFLILSYLGFFFFLKLKYSQLGLSRYPTHLQSPTKPDPPPIDPTSSMVGTKFVPPIPEFGGSDVAFPSLKSDQTNPTNPQDFQRYLVDPVRSRPFSSRS